VIKPMFADPPFGGFHLKLGIVISVCKERIERQTDGLALFPYFFITNADGFGS
jgi:hypothetical protein